MVGKRRSSDPNRPVRVEDVARVAGVSPITVSRALTNPDKVKEETRRKVAAAVAQTGYVVNSFASSLRSGRSPIVSVFASKLRNHHFASVLQGCTEALEGNGLQLLTARLGETAEEQRRVVAAMAPFRPAAMLFTDMLKPEFDRSVITSQNVPVVEMWDQRPDPVDMLVTISEDEAGRLMGHHFAERGFRRIAYAGQLYDRGRRRVAGFRAALAEHDLRCDLVMHVERGWEPDAGVEALADVLGQMPDCDAILFGTDILAAGALLAARRRGLRVPDQLGLAGFGDIPLAAYLDPPLTTLELSGLEMGRRAGQMLLRRLNGERVEERTVVFPLHLNGRQSTLR